jgi:hypothetical protein
MLRNKFICDLCNKEFKYKSKLEEHKNRKSKCNIIKDNNNCDICNVKFNFKSDLERHNKSKKHITNYNINDILSDEKEIKDKLEQEYESKLNKELQLKEYEINKLQKENEDKLNKLKKENELLKFNFEENIKINFDNEIEQELVPISTNIITHKSLNKININDILAKYSKLLNITDLLYIINYDLNKLYVDKFWNNIESEDWIDLDEELVNWFGYKEISRGKENIVKLLKKHHEIEEDYKILNNDEYKNIMACTAHTRDSNTAHEAEWNYGNVTKHILMNSDCFKNICILVGTNKSKDIRQYYIEVEKIFKFYLKYTLEFNKYELEKSKLIKNRYINKTKLKLDSILYLITTKNKANENIFKFGSTNNEKARKSSYNTGNVEAEKFFYVATYNCYDAMTLERRIAKLLVNFKIPNESEMYQLHFTALDNIIKEACKNDNDSIDKINNFISEEYNNYLNLESIKF